MSTGLSRRALWAPSSPDCCGRYLSEPDISVSLLRIAGAWRRQSCLRARACVWQRAISRCGLSTARLVQVLERCRVLVSQSQRGGARLERRVDRVHSETHKGEEQGRVPARDGRLDRANYRHAREPVDLAATVPAACRCVSASSGDSLCRERGGGDGGLDATAGPATGLQVGDVLDSLDGVPTRVLIEHWGPYYPASNQPTRLRDISRGMTQGACTTVRVGVRRRQAQIMTLTASRVPLGGLKLTERSTHDLPGDTFRMLSDAVAYLKLSSVKVSQVPDYVARAKGNQGADRRHSQLPVRVRGLRVGIAAS